MDANIPENFVAQLSGHKNFKSLDSYKSASTAHQSLVLSSSATSSSTTGSIDLAPTPTTECFQNNIKQQNLSYSNRSAVEAMFSGATIHKIEGCHFNFFLNSGKSRISEATFLKRRRVILSDDSKSE